MEPLLTQIDAAIDHFGLPYACGAMRKLDTQTSVINSQTTANKSALSTIEDVDAAKAATDYNKQGLSTGSHAIINHGTQTKPIWIHALILSTDSVV